MKYLCRLTVGRPCRWRWCSGCSPCSPTEIRRRCLGLFWLCPALRTAASPWGSPAASRCWSRSCMKLPLEAADQERPRLAGRRQAAAERPNPEPAPPSTTSSTPSRTRARPAGRWGCCTCWSRSGPTATAAGTGSRATQGRLHPEEPKPPVSQDPSRPQRTKSISDSLQGFWFLQTPV